MSLVAYPLLGALAGVIAVAALLRPRLAVLVLVAVTMTNAGTVLAPAVGFSPHVAALGFASAAFVIGVARKQIPLRLPAPVLLFAVAIVAIVPAVGAARNGHVAWLVLLELMKDLWMLLVLVLAGSALSTPLTLARVATASVTALAGLSLLNAFVLGNSATFLGFSVVSESVGVGTVTPRHAGPFDDPNFYGRVLVLVLPLAITLAVEAASRRAFLSAGAWSVSGVLLAGGVYLTQSRGAMMAMLVVVVIWMALAGPRSRRGLLLIPGAVLLAALLPGVGSRIASLSDLTPQPFTELDYSLVERRAAQEVVLAIFEDNPALGVGPGNIPHVWTEYMGAAETGITRQVAPHNLFFQLAAESGLIGLLGWLIFLGGVIVLAVRVVIALPVRGRAPPTADRLAAAGVAAAVAGWSVASLFLHLSYLRPLLVVVAVLGTIHLHLAEHAAADATEGKPPAPLFARRPVLVGSVVLALVLVAGAGAAAYDAWRSRVFVTEVPITLTPTPYPGADLADFYQQAISDDRGVVATYAAVVDRIGQPLVHRDGDLTLTVLGSPIDETIIVVRVEGPDSQRVQRAVSDVVDRSNRFVQATPSLAAVATIDMRSPSSYSVERWDLPFP